MGSGVHGRADYWAPGDWNAACSMCGRKRKASQLVRNWQGLWRCPEHNEIRQPQDFVRAIPDIVTPPWFQGEYDTDHQVCTLNGQTAIPGYAVAGCSIPGKLGPITPYIGMFSMTFTTPVDGLTAGTFQGDGIPFLPGTFSTTFNDGEIRNATYLGVTVTWSPALKVTQLGITSAYTIIGTF
jgi:hypothetical protein